MKPAETPAGRLRTCGSTAPDRIDPGLSTTCCKVSGGLADRSYFRTLAENAIRDDRMAADPRPRIHQSGLLSQRRSRRVSSRSAAAAPSLKSLLEAAKRAGVKVRYESPVTRLVMAAEGRRVSGVEPFSAATASRQRSMPMPSFSPAGGFQGNPAMMRAHFGPGAETLRLISPGTRFDSGDGIRMATDQGASVSGDWNGMHIEPIDPRSRNSAAGRAGVSLRDRRRSGRASLLRRGPRPHARDLGGLRPGHPFCAAEQYRLRNPRLPAVRDRRLSSARSDRRCRHIKPSRSKILRRRSAFPPAT